MAFISTLLHRRRKQLLQVLCGTVICILLVLNVLHEQENYTNEIQVILSDSEAAAEFQIVEIPRCDCKVKVERLQSDSGHEKYKYSETSCSRAAHARGYGQKIVGFSFYGDPRSEHHKSKKYYQGIVDNLRLMPKFYPGWIMR